MEDTLSMNIKRIETNSRMSKVVIHNNIAYLSGLVGDKLYASTTDQTKQILAQVDNYLTQAGTNKSKLLTAQIWLDDIRKFDEMNAVWDAWLSPSNAPTRACVESKMANPGYYVEILVTAYID
jgi:enamine deaminase RidA (YjgF/YER057c/UK114 family)